jgi:hypothetical protein
MKLAEGAIGDVNMLPEGTVPPQALQHHPLRVVAIDSNPEQSTSFARDVGATAATAGAAGATGAGAPTGGPHSDSMSRASSDAGLPEAELEAGGRAARGESATVAGSSSEAAAGGMANGEAEPPRLRVASAFGAPAAAGHAAAAAGASVSGG